MTLLDHPRTPHPHPRRRGIPTRRSAGQPAGASAHQLRRLGDPPAPPSGRPPRSPGGRFLGGAAVGALVGTLVAGGIVAVAEHGDGGVGSHAGTPRGSRAGAGRPAAAPAATNDIASLVQGAEPSIVAIHDSIAQTDMFGRTVEGQAAGTGFVLSADGYIVTNDHVVDGATDITVDFSDGSTRRRRSWRPTPTPTWPCSRSTATASTALPLGYSGDLQIGDQVVAIGNALDLSGAPTVTTGIVSATGRSLDEPNGTHLTNLLQTDTAINPGNSGGPLLDMQGEVVGINTAIAGQAQNIGFAIAIDPAKALIDQLQTGKVPAHALLGVSTQAVESGRGRDRRRLVRLGGRRCRPARRRRHHGGRRHGDRFAGRPRHGRRCASAR